MAEETWPSVRYGPDEQAQVFARAEDVPDGWKDHPSKVKGAAPNDEELAARRRPRPELMEALRQRGVQFAPNAGGGELAALLAASEPQAVEVDSNGKVLGGEKTEPADPAQPGPNPLDPAVVPHDPPPPLEFPSPLVQPAPASDFGQFAPLDRDQDGRDGGSLPVSPPALTGKNKDALQEIATAEGVEFPDDATNRELRDAIEAKRG